MNLLRGRYCTSVTRFGDFWKFLATNLRTKVAKKDCLLFGQFLKKVTLCKNSCYIYLGNFWKQLGHIFTPISGHTVLDSGIDMSFSCLSSTLSRFYNISTRRNMVVGVLKKYFCFTHVKWSSLARHTHSCVNAPLIKIAIKQFAIIGKQANTD